MLPADAQHCPNLLHKAQLVHGAQTFVPCAQRRVQSCCPPPASLLQVTNASFGTTFSLDTAGAVYYLISPSLDTSIYVEPGTVVGPMGATPVALPTQTTTYTTETLTVRGQPDTVTVNVPNVTVSQTGRRLMQQTETARGSIGEVVGFSPWNDDHAASGISHPTMLRCAHKPTQRQHEACVCRRHEHTQLGLLYVADQATISSWMP